MHKTFLSLLLVLLACSLSYAQLGRSLQACWAHLDKPFYVVDDVVGYQLYLPPEFEGQFTTVQTILFDANGQARWYTYDHNRGKSSLAGTLALSNDLVTSWYYLSFRVWDENRRTERVLLQVPLAIYNDQAPITTQEVSQQEPARLKEPINIDEKNLILNLRTEPENPVPGQEVRLIIKSTNRRGKPVPADVSVSINNWSQLSTSLAMGMDNLHTGDSLRVIRPDFLTGGFYWQGILLDEQNKARPNSELLAEVAGESATLTTDQFGRFLFQHSQAIGNSTFKLSRRDGQPASVQFFPQPGRLAMGRLFYTPAAFRYLETNRQRRKISKIQAPAAQKEVLVQQNSVRIHNGSFLMEGLGDQQDNSWADDPITPIPVRPGWLWQSGLKTDALGEVSFTYLQTHEPAFYRIDVVGQDTEGHRSRVSVLYKIDQ